MRGSSVRIVVRSMMYTILCKKTKDI
jgi:hypothetical protein